MTPPAADQEVRERRLVTAVASVFLGLPVWWVLGLIGVVPLLVAALLAGSLVRRREPLHLPPGSTWWFLFLLWATLGAFVLGVDAPGAAPGGEGVGRLLVFGYRLAWYLACTVFLIWLGNVPRARLADRTVQAMVTVVFAVTIAGGWLGLAAPHLEFTSALEALLGRGLRSNSFVNAIVHPQAADVQLALGRPETRPKAPFAFTNTWGSVMALSTVFAVAWALTGRLRCKVLVIAAGVLATVPIVFSLNRGLWACLALGAGGGLVLAVRSRRGGRVLVMGAVGVLAVALLAGPLVQLVNERFEHQHSNERRGQLSATTIASVSQGSPLVGFGSTRDVQGSFASISGGATAECPACGVPPLGTQGQVWTVLFSQGWVGVGLFAGFLWSAARRTWRCRTPNERVATFCLAFYLVQVFVYDTLGMPLLLVFVAVGLVWREQRESGSSPVAWTTPQAGERIRRGAPLAVGLSVVGAALGSTAVLVRADEMWRTEVRMVLSSPRDPYAPEVLGEVLGDRLGGQLTDRRDIPVTIDTEAALLLSEQALGRARSTLVDAAPATEVTTDDLRDAVLITAEPHTKILVLDVTGPTAPESRARAVAIARSYLGARQRYLDERRNDLLGRLNRDLLTVRPEGPATTALLVRLTSVETRLRSDTSSVGRVTVTGHPQEVAPSIALHGTSGAGAGLLLGVAFGAGLGPAHRHTRRRPRGGTT